MSFNTATAIAKRNLQGTDNIIHNGTFTRRNSCESKIITHNGAVCVYQQIQRKLDVLRSNWGQSTPVYTGALIKPFIKRINIFSISLRSCDSYLELNYDPDHTLSRLRNGAYLGLAFLFSSRISPLKFLISQILPRFQVSSRIPPNLCWDPPDCDFFFGWPYPPPFELLITVVETRFNKFRGFR